MTIIQENKLSELSLEMNGMKISIKANPIQNIHQNLIPEKKENIAIQKKSNKNYVDILSTNIGKYNYLRKDGTPVISVGQKIKEGQELGNIIAVGVKLPVISKFSGIIKEIYINNNEPVDYGKPLIKVKQSL